MFEVLVKATECFCTCSVISSISYTKHSLYLMCSSVRVSLSACSSPGGTKKMFLQTVVVWPSKGTRGFCCLFCTSRCRPMAELRSLRYGVFPTLFRKCVLRFLSHSTVYFLTKTKHFNTNSFYLLLLLFATWVPLAVYNIKNLCIYRVTFLFSLFLSTKKAVSSANSVYDFFKWYESLVNKNSTVQGIHLYQWNSFKCILAHTPTSGLLGGTEEGFKDRFWREWWDAI